MLDSFTIEGGVPLRGEVTPSGNKNAALPLMCAPLYQRTDILHNMPEIHDITAKRNLMKVRGHFEELTPHTWKIQAKAGIRRSWSDALPEIRATS